MAVGFLFLVLHQESEIKKNLFVLPETSGRSSQYWLREYKILSYTAKYTKVYEPGPSSRVREAALGHRGWAGVCSCFFCVWHRVCFDRMGEKKIRGPCSPQKNLFLAQNSLFFFLQKKIPAFLYSVLRRFLRSPRCFLGVNFFYARLAALSKKGNSCHAHGKFSVPLALEHGVGSHG